MCLLLTSAALTAGRRIWALTWVFAIAGLAGILWLPGYLQQHPERVTDIFYKSLLAGSPNAEFTAWLFALPLVLFAALAFTYFLRFLRPEKARLTQGFGFVAFSFFQVSLLALVVLPWWSQTIQGPVHALAFKFRDHQHTIVQWGVHLPSFASYRQQEAPRREPLPGEMALVRNTKPFWPSDWETVAVVGPLAVVKAPDLISQKP
jgi:hypothetical protein